VSITIEDACNWLHLQARGESPGILGSGDPIAYTPGDVGIFESRNVSIFFTPNATTPYSVGVLDLAKSGPVVIDMPAGAMLGRTNDFWQRVMAPGDQ
jgi:hypothetical protein